MSCSFSRLFGSNKSSVLLQQQLARKVSVVAAPGSSGSLITSASAAPNQSVSYLGSSVIRSFSNCHRASITRAHRLQYLRLYPTTVVNPDGSTFTIRYHEPRQIIKLPVDVNLLSESARNARLERRKPKTRVTAEEDFEDEGFDAKKYLKFVKK